MKKTDLTTHSSTELYNWLQNDESLYVGFNHFVNYSDWKGLETFVSECFVYTPDQLADLKENFDSEVRDSIKDEIKTLIEIEIMSHETDQTYYGSVRREENEASLHNRIETELDYNYEDDAEACEYFLKATPTEIWRYYLDTILPKL